MDHHGILIAIESNGYTQTDKVVELLNERLATIGYQTKRIDFPHHNEPSNYYVSQYEAGKYGNLEKSNTYIAALIYSMEHFDAAQAMQQALSDGQVVISQGYTGANLQRFGHNFSEPAERRGFYVWLDDLEHLLMKIPRPDKTYLLSANSSKNGANGYNEISQLFPKDYSLIDCTRGEQELSPEMVEDILWKTMSASLITPTKEQTNTATPTKPKQTDNHQPELLNLSESINKVLTDSASTFYMPKFSKDSAKVTYSQGLIKLNKLQRTLTGSLTAYFQKTGNAKTAALEAIKATWPIHPIAEITKVDIFPNEKLESGISKKILDSLAGTTQSYGSDSSMASLQKHSPSNELDLLSSLLYASASLSSEDLQASIDKLSIDKKNKLMIDSLVEIKKGSLASLEKVDFNYNWEFMTSYGAYYYLSNNINNAKAVHKPLSPRYGYETPEIIDKAGLNDEYEECYQESLSIFSQLQTEGFEREAQYLTLLGHKTHWTVNLNLASLIQLMELLKSSKEPELKQLNEKILEEITPTQPMIAEYLLV